MADDEPSEPLADLESPVSVELKDAPLVLWASGGFCRVFQSGDELDCTIAPEVGKGTRGSLVVGDRVRLDASSRNRVVAVLPRKSVLARPDPHVRERQRVLVANVDMVVHVVSIQAPPIRVRLIDRFLIAIQRGGSDPLLCVNKIDLGTPSAVERELEKLEPYSKAGIPIVTCSTKTREGIEPLRKAIAGRMSALVGHSGVGKTSVLNALNEHLDLTTGELHRKGTGRHTTSASTLYDLGEKTWLIDTPGIREFGLWDLHRDSLRDYFPEFELLAELCRFTDCSHIHEPGCEVKSRVEDNLLNASRYQTYLRLHEELGARK